MKPTANTLTATGLTLFTLSSSCLDSPDPYNYITGAVTLAGMIMMYLQNGGKQKNVKKTRIRKESEEKCWKLIIR